MSQTATAFDIKSASLDLLALHLKTADAGALIAALEERFAVADETEAFVLDLQALSEPCALDLGRLLPAFARRGVRAVALRHPDENVGTLARRFGLAYTPSPCTRHQEAPAKAETPRPAEAPAAVPTLIVDKPVRAGQQIYAKGGDLVVLAMVSAGAEVIADGSIHVYSHLRGRALAGARGNTSSRIFTYAMEAELVSIAGVYRTIEQALPASIKGRPTQVYLENERLVMSALGE
ncbi:septum site-determining protein MinC [Crenobacter cavernae]|uniref:Probable septum site-determining protein MinC n=1 Tax=Crenobacter cavernae TaxID=2290923 RepID=A0A345Y2N6_9NEIS|nr:septum site-determining protein MinC [Crenobacter cavernae]AXK38188.1 septum site-determining protein MinC [Crenobacter cavernae]